jgi:hypothetical protein
MLRAEMHDSENVLNLKLEGRFTGDDAENTRMLIARCCDGMKLVVDLTEVTFIDHVGESVLAFFGRFRAEFIAQTSYALDICERLSLCLSPSRTSDPKASAGSGRKLSPRKAHAPQPEDEKI